MGSIALVVGELTAHLSVDNDQFKRGLREAKGDMRDLQRDAKTSADGVGQSTERMVGSVSNSTTALVRDAQGKLRNSRGQFANEAEKIAAGMEPEFRKGGERNGSVLSQGIRTNLVRSSPLIVAAVSGALVAGAPLMLAAATTLFAGVGIVAAAQSDAVQSAWLGTWQKVSEGAQEDAAVLEGTLVGIADRAGDAFDAMRPRLRGMFDDLGPQIDIVADGLLGMANNSLPGMQRAIENNLPVVRGLADFLEKTGTGLSDFFDAMSDNAPAAGRAFSDLGDTMGILLPTLGELLGTGAELANTVLPLLNGSLSIILGTVQALGPVLPIITTGFLGMKVAGVVTNQIGKLSGKLGEFADKGGLASGVAGKLSSGLGTVKGAAGPLGAAVAILSVAYADSEAKTRAWTDALNQGGAAARQARAEMSEHAAGMETLNSGFIGFIGSLTTTNNALKLYNDDVDNAEEGHRRWWASLSPLEQAQAKVAEWTDELSRRLNDETATTAEVEAAKRRLKVWADKEADAQNDVEAATRSVTEAMAEQGEQAMAAIDSGFGYRRSVNQLEDAQDDLADATKNLTNKNKENRTTQEDVERAQLALEEQTFETARAYGRQQADLTGLDKTSGEYADTLQRETIKELQRLRKSAGPEMRAAIDEQLRALTESRSSLDKTGTRVDSAKQKVNTFSDAVDRIPAAKTTTTTVKTAAARAALATLQRTINGLRGKTINVHTTYSQAGGGAPRSVAAPNRASGGPIFGPGSETSDSIPVNLSNGEYVIRAAAVRKYGTGLFHRLNTMSAQQNLAAGGPVGDIRLNLNRGGIEKTISNLADLKNRTININVASPSPSGGGGAVPGSYQAMFSLIKQAFPAARLNSGYRPGDPGYHGRGKAVDLGQVGRSGGMGHPYLAAMNRWIHDKYGARSAELIYDGAGDDRPDLKNGRPLNYGAATRRQHYNHVHWATYDHGGLARGAGFLPKQTPAPERVLSPRQTEAFEKAMDRGWTARGGDVHVHVTGVMDLTNRQAVRKLGDVVFERIKERERELR